MIAYLFINIIDIGILTENKYDLHKYDLSTYEYIQSEIQMYSL